MFIDSIDLYPDKKKPGNLVQMVHFRFPVSYNGEAVYDYSPPEKSNDETVVLLSKNVSTAVNLGIIVRTEATCIARHITLITDRYKPEVNA